MRRLLQEGEKGSASGSTIAQRLSSRLSGAVVACLLRMLKGVEGRKPSLAWVTCCSSIPLLNDSNIRREGGHDKLN